MPAEAANTPTTQPTIAPNGSKVIKVPGVQLDIPLGKDVVIRIPGVEQSYRGKIVGYDPYDYIIANVRLPSHIRRDLSFSGTIILKFVHKGTVYGFKATVQNAISSPAPLIFINYPDVIEKIDLRQTSRLHCNIDAMLQTLDAEYECMVVNVSESGCKISARAGTRDSLKGTKIGDTMVVAMTLGHFGAPKLPIAVRNVSHEKGLISMGAMFLDINKNEVETIQKYLDKIARFTR